MAKDESPRLNGASPRHDSPRRRVNPNIRTQRDLEKALEALHVSDQENQKIHIQQQKILAENVEMREAAHAKALEMQQEQTRIHQERIRQQAQAALRKWQEDQEREQQRRREAERQRIEKEARERAERERQIQLENERLEREAQARAEAEAARKRQEAEQAAKAEADRRQKEEQERQKQLEAQRLQDEQRQQQAKAKEEADRIQRESQAKAEAAAQSAKLADSDSPEKVHQEYLELYHKIKTWKNGYWQFVRDQAKIHKDPAIKDTVAEARRTMTAEVGKLTDDKGLNKIATAKIRSAIFDNLDKPTKTVGTMMSVNDFLPASLQLNDNNAAKISDQSVYALCILAQKVVNIMMKYACGEPQRAESIGVMVCTIFANASIQYPRQNPRTPAEATQSLFPILLAKYHKLCPVLFGITAASNDQQGRLKLGWALLPSADDSPKSVLVPENEHFDRMKGLATGYSSIALRNFAGASMRNPYPPVHFWRSLALIVNLPPEKVTPTHVCVLRNMFGHRGMTRFVLFFGSVGHAALKEAFVEFPRRLPQEMQGDSFVRELSIYVEKLAKDEHIHFD